MDREQFMNQDSHRRKMVDETFLQNPLNTGSNLSVEYYK